MSTEPQPLPIVLQNFAAQLRRFKNGPTAALNAALADIVERAADLHAQDVERFPPIMGFSGRELLTQFPADRLAIEVTNKGKTSSLRLRVVE